MGEWQDESFKMKSAGFSDSEIADEGQRLRGEMAGSGFQSKEIDEYFGAKEPDMAPVKKHFEDNIAKVAEEQKAKAENSTTPQKEQPPSVAKNLLDAMWAGYENSSWKMMSKAINGEHVTPDMILPEDADSFYRIASQVGTIAGDLPAMAAGAFAGATVGAAAGSAIPVAGNVAGGVIGAGAGGNALPVAIRESLMNYYEKGEIHSFKDFWERTSAAFINTSKAAIVGGATAGVGGKVLSGASEVLAPSVAKTASVASEIATMVTVGKGLEGEMPNAQDFTDAAITVGGLHAATAAAGSLRNTFAKTGMRPWEVAQEAQSDVTVKQDLLVKGNEIPDSFKSLDESPKDSGSMKINGMLPEQPSVEEAPDVAAAREKIRSQIVDAPEKTKEPLTLARLRMSFIDKYSPIENVTKSLEGKNLPTSENPYQLFRMANDAPAKALHFLGDSRNPQFAGVLDFNTLEKTGPSLGEILKPFKDDISKVDDYLASKRAVTDYANRGLESGFDLEAAKTIVKDGGDKLAKAQKQITDYSNGVSKYAMDAGLVAKEGYELMVKANENYVPFKRIQEDGSTGSGPSKKAPFKKVKGGEGAIQSPIQSIVENTQSIIEMAEKNRAVKSLIELAEKDPEQKMFEKVELPKKAITISDTELIQKLKAQGIDDVNPDAITVFRKADQALGKDEFEVYRDGKREVWKATDPNVAESIKLLDGNATSQNMFMSLARSITAVKRIGITFTPDFVAKNLFRDAVTANVFSQSEGGLGVKDVVFAMGDLMKKNEAYHNWLKSGGANGAFIEMDKIHEQYKSIPEDARFLDKAWNVVQTPKHMLEFMGTLSEQSLRLAEFKKVSKGASSGPDVFKGGFASREVTLDFQKIGAKMAAFNSIVAFANVQVQGADKLVSAFRESPLKTTAQMAARTTMRSAALITVPSVILWWLNKDDERVKEIPQWQKDRFWIFATDSWEQEKEPGEAAGLPDYLVRDGKDGRKEINKGTISRFPKPQELGLIFGSAIERTLDAYVKHDPEAYKNLGDTIKQVLTPSYVPDILSPIIEQATNKSLFTGNKVVPGYLEKQLPESQYTNYTSQTARALGKMVGYVPFIGNSGPADSQINSPMVIENYVRSWGGALGEYALEIADKALQATGLAEDPVKPAWSVGDIPVLKSFVIKYPSQNAESIRKFYDKFDASQRVINSIHSLTKRGDIDAAEKLMNDPSVQDKLANLSGIKEGMQAQGNLIQTIYRDKENYTPEEKKQLIESSYYRMIEAAKMGNQMFEDLKQEGLH